MEEAELDDEAWAKAVQSGNLSKGERLVPVDHSAVSYPPFRKVRTRRTAFVHSSSVMLRMDCVSAGWAHARPCMFGCSSVLDCAMVCAVLIDERPQRISAQLLAQLERRFIGMHGLHAVFDAHASCSASFKRHKSYTSIA